MLDERKTTNDGAEFFAAANSGNGFVSFYEKIFNNKNIERRYLIKGGPGTGKSTFMRKVADALSSRGVRVDRYRCSSDPASLDGIVIDGRIAIIDSTSPHAVEPDIAGARDVLINLGAFWSVDGLSNSYERISELSAQKKRAYSLAYRFLCAAMQSDIASRELLYPYLDKKRLKKIAKHQVRSIGSDGAYECHVGLSSAIGMSGRFSLDSYAKIAKRVVYIEDHYGIGSLALAEICELALQNQNKISVSYEPLTPDCLNAVYFENSGVAFLLCKPREKKAVSLRRALDITSLSKKEKNSLKARSRNAKKLAEALVIAATDELFAAGNAHFELEEIYKSNMDFNALELFTSQFVEEIVRAC